MLPDLPIPPLAMLVELERVALHVATEAALLIVDRSAATVAATKSSPTDVVTEMDRRSQELVQTLLRAERPQDGFFGEEDGRAAGTSEITWVVDPIDGTVNYVYDIPAYAVSVAAVVGDPQTPGAWRPVAGAVVNPVTGERFWARAGGGAWRQRGRFDPVAVHASGQADPAASLVATGFSYDADTRAWQAAVLTEVLPAVRDIRRGGSAALDLCHVADATLDGYYEHGLNPWDFGAGWLIVEEAGGAVAGPSGQAPDRPMTIAAGAGFGALSELVRRALEAADRG